MVLLMAIIIFLAIISLIYVLSKNSNAFVNNKNVQENKLINVPITTSPNISIQLPEYIGGQKSNWPPVIKESGEPYSCTPGASGMGVRKETTERTINGKTYCVTYIGEGAVGITYKTYTFTTFSTQGTTKTTTFTLSYFNCEGYGVPGNVRYDQCKTNQANFDIDTVIASLM